MKRLIILLCLVLTSIGVQAEYQNMRAIDANASVSDVLLSEDIAFEFPDRFNTTMIFSGIDVSQLDETLTILIYGGEVINVVGVNAPSSAVLLSADINAFFVQADIPYTTIMSDEVPDDIKSLFTTTSTCTDSDGGMNFVVAGGATQSDGMGLHDYCDFTGSDKGTLFEAYCDNGFAARDEVTCPDATPYCNRGVCSANYPECTDTDGGNQPGQFGTIVEPRMEEGPEYSDYCQSLSTKQPMDPCDGPDCGIREFYCNDPYYTTTFKDIACPLGCKDGECIIECEECTEGELRCSPNLNAFDWCADVDGDGCTEWALKAYCDPDETCVNGGCQKIDQGYPTLDLKTPEVNGKIVIQNGVTSPICGEIDKGWCKEKYPSAEGSGPFLFKWGDGTYDCSWFPADHTYNAVGEYKIHTNVMNTCGKLAERYQKANIEGENYIRLGEKFKLHKDESVTVKDFKNLELTLTRTESECYKCPVCDTTKNSVCPTCPPCREEASFSVSIKKCDGDMCGGAGTRLDLKIGESEEVFGAKITLLDMSYDWALVVITEENQVTKVHLGEIFDLYQNKEAVVTDYNGMTIRVTGFIDVLCSGSAHCKPGKGQRGVTLTVELPEDCGTDNTVSGVAHECGITGTQLVVMEGQSSEAYGANIHLKNLYYNDGKNKAMLMVSLAKQDIIYTQLDEKFKLSNGMTAKVKDYSGMALKFNGMSVVCYDSGGCETGASLEVSLGDISTIINVKEGGSTTVFGAKVGFLYQSESSAVFVVSRTSTENLVEVIIDPEKQTIRPGDIAVYKVKVQDLHPVPDCVASGCEIGLPTYRYHITVQNLPFNKEFDNYIKVTAGKSEYFKLVVTPYKAVREEPEPVHSNLVTGNPVYEKVATEYAKTASGSSGQSEIAYTPLPSMRKYRFTVTATSSEDPGMRDSASAYLIIEPKIDPPPMPEDKVQIKLYKGWNLVSLPGKLIRFERSSSDKLIGFVWLKDEQMFVSLNEAEDILGEGLREYLMKNAFWVYSRSNAMLSVRIDHSISASDIDIVEGWNMVPITEDMLGGYLSDLMSDCRVDRMHLWDAKNQGWDSISTDYSFTELGYGFVLKANDKCRLYGPELTPPPMPE